MSTAGWSGRAAGPPILEVEDLHVTFSTPDGPVHAVRGVDLELRAHESLGIVGESGSGKSVTMLAVMGLLARNATVTGSIRFEGEELVGRTNKQLRPYRGEKLSMIFQDPMTSLNPVLSIGYQIAEIVRAHRDVSREDAQARAVELLELVGIPNARERVKQYPHEFSGGMRQRAMIALAIANDPAVLIADEPTTALDVTIQAQVLEVIQRVQEVTGTALVLITHDLGIVARTVDRVMVMYAGRPAEKGEVLSTFEAPRHPYTLGLLRSLPRLHLRGMELEPIPGNPPSMLAPPPGCPFHPRCAHSQGRERCRTEVPELRLIETNGQMAACHFAEELRDEEVIPS